MQYLTECVSASLRCLPPSLATGGRDHWLVRSAVHAQRLKSASVEFVDPSPTNSPLDLVATARAGAADVVACLLCRALPKGASPSVSQPERTGYALRQLLQRICVLA